MCDGTHEMSNAFLIGGDANVIHILGRNVSDACAEFRRQVYKQQAYLPIVDGGMRDG